MDGIDIPFAMTLDGCEAALRSSHEQLAAPVHASPRAEPAAQYEIDAIASVVPAAYRKNAAWAIPLLIDTARSGGMTHPRRIAYLLATAQHASRCGAQLVEAGQAVAGYSRPCFFDRYEPGTALGTAYGNTQPGDGERYRGRGFVPVRGRANYANWSHRLGLPEQIVDGQAVPFLVAQPEVLARPDVAAQTLVRGMRDGIFTGWALGYYVNDKKTDYYNARRVIDGTSHAHEVAALAVAYQTAIEGVATERHRATMRHLGIRSDVDASTRNLLEDVRAAVARLAVTHGENMAHPTQILDWTGEARQGKFVQLDEYTCALHLGRGIYVRLDIQRDLNGVTPPEARNLALKRTGDVRPALRSGAADFWR